jgi:protoporphyrinogen oxidase
LPLTSLVVIGAGPSGLAAAYEAVSRGYRAIVLEKLPTVGGLARTVRHNGDRFDIGPHRFFTLNPEIRAFFREMAGTDLRLVRRRTRILYANRFFDYPLTPINALLGLGPLAGLGILASYGAARLRQWFRPRPPESFEDWVVDRFGRRLYETFFKSYTEKVWGIPCSLIDASWAEQRIKGFSLGAALADAFLHPGRPRLKTLADEFMSPRHGAGQLYENMMRRIEAGGGTVITGAEAGLIRRDGFCVTGAAYRQSDGAQAWAEGDFYLSSAPLSELLAAFDPPPPADVLAAGGALRYRHHISAQLTLKGPAPFADNWIYIHSPDLAMARVASYRNFSSEMAAASDRHPMTVEYFCFDDQPLWRASDGDILALARRELTQSGLAGNAEIVDGFVVRSPKAYPVIERGADARIAVIRGWLDRFENFLPIGRSGMFKYNNQDHAMATGIFAARRALGLGDFDPWQVNIDGVHQEGGAA